MWEQIGDHLIGNIKAIGIFLVILWDSTSEYFNSFVAHVGSLL